MQLGGPSKVEQDEPIEFSVFFYLSFAREQNREIMLLSRAE